MSARGLEPLAAEIVERAARALGPGCHHEAERNKQRLIGYIDRLCMSADPYASDESVGVRAAAGERIKAAWRHSERIKHLRARVRMVHTPEPLPHNVVRLSQRAL
ncbi:MAG: hypothetical protein CVV18_00370 [Gammaproteobacteria bacterium HGW-Gammaproteobacteria-8]|jgi:hypothetical protein|nr:MAG: hypothetical protein CVV18_00370 [Gammaproteobacteria bacterium HGW-Gammaproteobacteria-8]